MHPGSPAGAHRKRNSRLNLVRDVFWDLFRQGFITLGLNDSNPNWPWFRLSHFGERALKTQSPYRFHDTGSFIGLVRTEVHKRKCKHRRMPAARRSCSLIFHNPEASLAR